jgi:hypothetical protein
MAVRARKPLLVVAENQVAGRFFEHSTVHTFHRDDLDNSGDSLRVMLDDLRAKSRPYVRSDDLLGSVGLVMRRDGDVHRRAREAVRTLLLEAGYSVQDFEHDPEWSPQFGRVDRMDFFVVDIDSRELTNGLYWRFVPAVRLAYQPEGGPRTLLPGLFKERSLEMPDTGGSRQSVIWWSDERELVDQLRSVVDKMQRPRRQFRSHDEGVGYFDSIVRGVQGPVFISNTKGINGFARDLSRAMDISNITFFQYQHKNPIAMGVPWEEPLIDQLKASRLFVALVTEDYAESPECRKELRLAQEMEAEGRIRIFKYYLDGASNPSGVSARLQEGVLTDLTPQAQIARIKSDVDDYLIGLSLGSDVGPN